MTSKKNFKINKPNLILLLVVCLLAVLLVIFQLLKLNTDIAENFFARGASRSYLNVFIKIGNAVNFSLYDTFIILGILVIATFIFLTLFFLFSKRKKLSFRFFMILCIIVFFFANIYTLAAGGNYNRYEMPVSKYEGEELEKDTFNDYLITLLNDYSNCSEMLEYNENGKSICPYTFDELNIMLQNEYSKINDSYFNEQTALCKNSIFSSILSYENITGVALVFIGQATINSETPDCYKVVTMAHEMAHMKGCLRERDANNCAYYLLLNSDNYYLRYCGYMYSIRYLTSVSNIYDNTAYKEIYDQYMPKKAIKDLQLENAFWETKQGIIEKISSFFNDLYLKISGVKEGEANYNDPSKYSKDEKSGTIKISYSTAARILIKVAQNKSI